MVSFGCVHETAIDNNFYLQRRKDQYQPVIEQVGTYDPIPNEHNEQLVSFNYERIRHWIGSGAHISKPVAELLGNQPHIHSVADLDIIMRSLLHRYCRLASSPSADLYDRLAK